MVVSFLPLFATYTQPFSTICQAKLIPLSADRKPEGQGMRFFYAFFNPYTYQPANIPNNSDQPTGSGIDPFRATPL